MSFRWTPFHGFKVGEGTSCDEEDAHKFLDEYNAHRAAHPTQDWNMWEEDARIYVKRTQ